MDLCSVAGCTRRRHARGWCNTHYQRWREHGSLDDPQPLDRRCEVDGCDRKHEAHGYCQKHVRRWQKHGDALAEIKGGKPYTGRTPEKARAVLLSRRRISEGGCWEYTGAVTPAGGYGAFTWLGHHGAHRASYALFVAQIPPGMAVCHKCDNPPCFNPKHLFLGTFADNNRDMGAKGRGRGFRFTKGHRLTRPSRGEANGGGGKLTAEQALAIFGDSRRQADIAAEYGISQVTVSAIKRGRLWRHATELASS